MHVVGSVIRNLSQCTVSRASDFRFCYLGISRSVERLWHCFILEGENKKKRTDNYLQDSYKNYISNNTVVLQSFSTSVIQLVQ